MTDVVLPKQWEQPFEHMIKGILAGEIKGAVIICFQPNGGIEPIVAAECPHYFHILGALEHTKNLLQEHMKKHNANAPANDANSLLARLEPGGNA